MRRPGHARRLCLLVLLSSAAWTAAAAVAQEALDLPPERLPPDARLATGAVHLGIQGLPGLPPGFGIPGAAAGTTGGGDLALPGAAVLDPESGPPPRLPADARLDTGTVLDLGDTSLTFADTSINLGATPLTGGATPTTLGGLAVIEEEGGLRFTLGADVLFDFDKADIRADADPILRELVREVEARLPQGARYRVEGHTDWKGSDAYNDRLSDRRARAVKAWLTRNAGVPGRLIGTVGFGERRPVAPNENPDGSDNPEGRQKNRRVEIVVAPVG